MSRTFCLSGIFAVIALLLSGGCNSTAPVQPLSIGSQVDFNLLEDQHGNAFPHQDNMRLVLYVSTMSGKNLVRDALSDIDPRCLKQGRVVYLADIGGMPSLISKLIAVPRMRDFSYPIWLDYNGLATAALPLQEDEVTLLTVDKLAITAVDFVADTAQLLQRLLTECEPASQQVAQYGGVR